MDKLYKLIFNEKTVANTIFIGFIISFFAFLLFILKGSWEFDVTENIGEEKIAQFGDFIGGVIGTIFSLVGVILFYISLKEQREDFKTNQEGLKMQLQAFDQQIREFELQRDELTETRKIFEQQTKTMRNQQFESNFYSLLNVFINNRLRLVQEKLFQDVIKEMKQQVSIESIEKTIESIHVNYFNQYLAKRGDLAMYFMSLYRLFKIIEECSHLENGEKIYYHKILRSQISKDELLVLYYNYHSEFGKKPLPIVLRYDYFKHLEILSKIEFEVTFNFSTSEIIHLNKILHIIRELLYRNIEKAKELGEDYVKQEVEIFKDVFIGIYIDEYVEVKLVIKNNLSEIEQIEISRYKEAVKFILIDTLYNSKFKKFDNSDLNESLTTSDKQKEYNFKFISSNE